MNYPQGLAIDVAGNLFISDGENHVIRKINAADGIISTVAGNHLPGFGGDGAKATDASLFYPRGIALDASGNLFIADTFNQRIRRVAEDGTITTIAGDGVPSDLGDDVPAETAELFFPHRHHHRPERPALPRRQPESEDQAAYPRSFPPPHYCAHHRPPTVSSAPLPTAPLSRAAPGSWIEIYGANFAGATTEWTANDFVNGHGAGLARWS
ncbi:MAG: hypothetical protein WDN31_11080 [Hyphomicrobium sp.]